MSPSARARSRPSKPSRGRASARRPSKARRSSSPARRVAALPGRPVPEVREALEVLEQVLSKVRGQADARYYGDRWVTLRCANTRLYQPHAESTRSVSLRVAADGGRLGIASTTDLSPQGLATLVEQASSLARVAPATKGFAGFVEESSEPTPTLPFASEVLSDDLEVLGKHLADAFGVIEDALGAARISGVYNRGASVVAIANTGGLRRGYRKSAAQASLLAELPKKDPPVSGWAEGSHWDPRKVDLRAMARQAVAATPRTAPRSVEPGKYRVLLQGPAVGEMLGHLTWLGLGAHAVEEGWSFLVDARGKRVVAPAVELEDDPLSVEGIPTAVDYEGLPHRRRPIFHDGKAEGPAHDSVTARRAKTATTRNALPPEAPYGELGPLPLHLSMAPGDLKPGDLVRELRRGILVTRFWYVRAVHPGKTIITGMTRDGTYWVDKGEVQYPIRNLRFTESILGTLDGVEGLGRERACYSDERAFAAPVLPSIISRSFTFNSATTF